MLRNTARQARAPQQNRPPLVRSGSKHDYASSTHMSASTSSGCNHALDHGSDVPGPDASLCGHKVTLLDHLVGKREQLVWNFESLMLITRSNLVGCSTGISPGFTPPRILSARSAARRNMSGKLAP